MLEPKAEIFRAIVDRVEAGVYAVDMEQKIAYWNHGAEKITGYLSQEGLGRTCADKFLVECGEHNPLTCTQHGSQETTRDGMPKVVAYVRAAPLGARSSAADVDAGVERSRRSNHWRDEDFLRAGGIGPAQP